MKYIKILITTFFILFIPLKAYASCDLYTRYALSGGNIGVSIISGGQTSSVSSSSGSVLLPTNTDSITSVTKDLYTTFDSDFLIMQGSLEFLSFGDSLNNNNPNLPNVNNIPAPFIAPINSLSNESYCEFLSLSVSSSNNYLGDSSATSTSLTPRLSSFDFTLKCHRHQNFPSSRVTYRLTFNLGFNLFSDDGFTLNTEYRINSSFRSYVLGLTDSCSPDDILGAIHSMNYDVIDIGDKLDNIGDFLSDDSVSTSVLGATNFFNQQDGSYYGLADFVSAIINFMKAIYDDYSCTPLQLPALLGTSITLPCFSEWLHDFNETFYNLWKMVLYFYVGFVICSDLIKFIHDLRDPQNDNLTVIDI